MSCWLLDDEPCVMEGSEEGARGSRAWGRGGAVGCLAVEVGHGWTPMVKSQKNRTSSEVSTPHPPRKKSVSHVGRPRHTIP